MVTSGHEPILLGDVSTHVSHDFGIGDSREVEQNVYMGLGTTEAQRSRTSLKDETTVNGLPNGHSDTLGRMESQRSYPDPGPPPDGGLKAWTQAIIAHIVIFSTWGYINSFGVFQTYYVATLNQPPSAISWVGSVQIFLLFFIGTFSGRATDAGWFRTAIITGSFFQLVGIFMTSFATEYWQLFLAQGLCTGLGNGLLFCPTLSSLSTYFSKRRSIALAIASSGTATGSLLFPALVEVLLPKIGFPWTIRVLGFVMLGLQAITIAFAKTRLPPRKAGPIVEWAAFYELSYTLFGLGMFLCFWGIYFAFYYVGSFARDMILLSRAESINLLLVMNGVGFFGRLVPAYFADHHFGPMNILIPYSFVAGLMLYCWAAVSDRTGLYVFAVFYGLFASGVQSLFPAALSGLTTDLKKAGVRMGMVFTIISFACLTGAPLAGALIQERNGSYLVAQMFAGTVFTIGGITLIGSRIAKTGYDLKVKV